MVHSVQEHLGRVVIWCKRPDAIDLTEATEAEQQEFLKILKEVQTALTQAFQPDLFNYAFLGNKTRHLHCHVVPRYRSPREFSGRTFIDSRWGQNYLTNPDFTATPEVLEAIKDKLKEVLR